MSKTNKKKKGDRRQSRVTKNNVQINVYKYIYAQKRTHPHPKAATKTKQKKQKFNMEKKMLLELVHSFRIKKPLIPLF